MKEEIYRLGGHFYTIHKNKVWACRQDAWFTIGFSVDEALQLLCKHGVRISPLYLTLRGVEFLE